MAGVVLLVVGGPIGRGFRASRPCHDHFTEKGKPSARIHETFELGRGKGFGGVLQPLVAYGIVFDRNERNPAAMDTPTVTNHQ